MKIKFLSNIRKGNKRGTGFFYIPRDKENLLDLGKRVKVELPNDIYFFSKVIKHNNRSGIYLPKKIMLENQLFNRNVEFRISEINGFYSRIYLDGRIYIPKDIAENQKLKQNNIVLIKGIENNKVVKEKYSKINVYKKKKRMECMCIFDKSFYDKELIFKIEKKAQGGWSSKPNLIPLDKIFKDMNCALINKDSLILFKGNRVPAIVNINLKYPDIAFYLGAYFADGTKKGNSWAICASTFKQATHYLSIHNFLVKDSKPKFAISYTNIEETNDAKLKKKLSEIWKKETDIEIDEFWIRKQTGKAHSKWNKYGTLIIREHRQIVLDFYNILLASLIREIILRKDKKLVIDFICGVMEGDGCVPAKKRGHIMIFSNKNEVHVLENILRIAQIKFKIVREDENKYAIRIGALELLKNFHQLKDKIFILYPKRRKRLFERLKTVSTVKFLIGGHKSTNWVKAWLRDNDFCDENYKITKNGLGLRGDLLNGMREAKMNV